MNLVDSSGWLEYFADGPNAEFFAPPIEDAANLIVPSITNNGSASISDHGDEQLNRR